ncbi:hypothetical protein CYCD_11550 [Tenuifilaceae bacterium CYCD]|nr:hypothetical protein CYCD_11550 [Tenuifilaceae bacterium CYCD]
MKRLTFILLFILVNHSLFADGAKCFRYKLKLSLKSEKEIIGYSYFCTRNQVYNKNESFYEYVKKEFRFPILVYEKIKTIEISTNYNLDFSIKDSHKTIELRDIKSIELIEQLEYPSGERNIKVSENQFNLIQSEIKIKGVVYNEKLAENCSFFLLSWLSIEDFESIKKEISEKIEELCEAEMRNKTYEYINNKKIELADKGILLFQACDEL